jgi:methyl-accepting chemotaxis protein
LLITAGVVFVIVTGITRPIASITGAMISLAEGNNDVEIAYAGRHDEIGDMAKTVQVFKDNAIEKERLTAEQEVENKKREERANRLDGLCGNFDGNISGVVEAVSSASTQVESTAGSMAATAEQTSRQSAVVASATEEATTNVQTVASAAQETGSAAT